MRRDGSFRQTAKRQLDDSIHAGRSFAARRGAVLPAYERLLRHVRTRTPLLHPSGRAGDDRTGLNAGLLALALYHADWLRPAESWRPAERNPWPQFSSLAQHLLARYPVPPFMATVWFDLPPGARLPQHEWYKHLGRGENIRTAGLPLRLTRAMAHLFTQAPHHYSAVAAVRWAQVRGLGGDERLARAVVGTRLGRVLGNEEFWEGVLLFFINHPALDLAGVGPVVDFLQHQKFEWKEGVSPQGVFGRLPPPRPGYTMKGRTVASLLRQVEEWYRELGREANEPTVSWRPAPFNEFRLVQGEEGLGNMRVWTITEILTSRALLLEGRAMRHCVASYTGDCVRRQTSIWSMQVETHRGRNRSLTIEVDISKRTIRQVRGKCNRLPSANERALVGRWAAQEGLAVHEASGL
ncbi:MAG TPA: PcfJ domain-containing protein [Gemmataceae bacterium]|nr:PcfJ domain-containing protein [Gemmataceae bacterium]